MNKKNYSRKIRFDSMASRSVFISVVVLRFRTLGLLPATIVVLATDKFTLSDGTKISFKDVIAYRYVIATGITSFLCNLVQMLVAIYHAYKGKRLLRNKCHPEFDFVGDKIIAFLLATGSGAGFAVTFEFKKLPKDFIESVEETLGASGLDETDSNTNKFLDKANIAAGLLFLGFIFMAVLSVLSSMNRSSRK